MKRPENKAKVSGDNSPTKRPEVRAKMCAAKAGRIITVKWRKNMSAAQTRRNIDPTERAKHGAANIGKIRINNGSREKLVCASDIEAYLHDGWFRGAKPRKRVSPSEETRRKISLANKGREAHNKGKPSPLKGMKRTDDIRQSISSARTGGRWITNGVDTKYTHDAELPEGWTYGRSTKRCV